MKPLVSLDIFDTAIFRKVYHPTDIFSIVEDKIGKNFKELRIRAQEKAAKRLGVSYNILDIYKYLYGISPREEIRAEYYNCRPNPYILDMYNKGEADYIFISDMYLPSDVLKSMLEKCGYENPQVFVSCEYKMTKGHGELFKRVEEVLGRKISKHIGDNYFCDIMGAERVGIKGHKFIGPPIYERTVITPELDDVRLRKLIIDEELSNSSIEEKIGYSFAPLALAFTKAILDEARETQTVFFNARDSFVMYIIARWLLKTNKKVKYCRVSRKSCYLPGADPRGLKLEVNSYLVNFLRDRRVKSYGEFVKTFGLKNYHEVLKKHKVTENTPVEFNDKKRREVTTEIIFACQDEILEKAKEEKARFLKYIKNLGMNNGDIFVDLGHRGSMQAMIERITGMKLYGRYLHTADNLQEYKGVKLNKESFIPAGTFCGYQGIVEVVFSEPKGTTVTYDDKGLPVISNDLKFRKGVTRGLIKGILRGVKDMLKEEINPNLKDSLKLVLRFLKQPTLQEAEFANKDLFENGSFESNESIAWFNVDKIKEGKLRECYTITYWKEALRVLIRNSNKYKSLERFLP